MKVYAIFIALFIFSLATGDINQLAAADDDSTAHLVYADVQGLDITEEQMRQPSALDIINFVGFVFFITPTEQQAADAIYAGLVLLMGGLLWMVLRRRQGTGS